MKFKEVDLDILRGLNENNINDNPSLRDSFFNSLKELEDIHPLVKGLIEEEKQNVDSRYKSTYTEEKNVSCELSEALCKDLVDCMTYEAPIKPVKDRNDVIELLTFHYIEIKNIAKRICIISYLYNIVKTIPCSFFELKAAILKGLIINCCKDLSSFEKQQKLNKLIIMYAEHIKGLEPFEEIPMIIDDEFLGNISDNMNEEGDFYLKGIWDDVNNLIQKNFNQRNRKICKHGRTPFSSL